MSSKLILQRDFTAAQTRLKFVASNRESTPRLEEKIDKVWRNQQEKARRQGYDLWDAEGYRLNELSVDGDVIVLEIADVPYHIHSAMKELHTDPQFREENYDKLIVADALIRTSDGFYIFAQVDKVAEQEVVLVGGSCTKERLKLTTSKDLFDFIHQRVADVLNISRPVIAPPTLRGVIQNNMGYINLIFSVQLSVSSKELTKKFTPNSGVSGLVFVKEFELKTFLRTSRGYIRTLTPLIGNKTGITNKNDQH